MRAGKQAFLMESIYCAASCVVVCRSRGGQWRRNDRVHVTPMELVFSKVHGIHFLRLNLQNANRSTDVEVPPESDSRCVAFRELLLRGWPGLRLDSIIRGCNIALCGTRCSRRKGRLRVHLAAYLHGLMNGEMLEMEEYRKGLM